MRTGYIKLLTIVFSFVFGAHAWASINHYAPYTETMTINTIILVDYSVEFTKTKNGVVSNRKGKMYNETRMIDGLTWDYTLQDLL